MGGVNVQLQSFLILALVEGEFLASRLDLFDLGKEHCVLNTGLMGFGEEKYFFARTGNRTTIPRLSSP
jgi:hypothetical protein